MYLRQRMVWTFFVFALCLAGLIFKCWEIQIRSGDRYASLALSQDSIWVSLEDVPRGRILDRSLVPLTETRLENRVVVFPEVIRDRNEVSAGLAEILGVDAGIVGRYLEGASRYLPYPVTSEQSAAITEKGWTGVKVFPVRFRYGEKPLAAQLVGHLGRVSSREELSLLAGMGKKIYRFDDLVGKTGLEKYYEQDLKGLRPQLAARIFKDAGGRLLGGPEFIFTDQGADRERRDVVLTIDSNIQTAVENIMDLKVTRGAVVVMEAGSGDILAMASRPTFNPSCPGRALDSGPEKPFLDRCVSLYQPGSIFKLVLAAAALEEGIISLESQFICRGEKESLIRCWKDAGHGEIKLIDAFALSCNPAFARLGLNLGAQKVIEYAEKFGLNNQAITGYTLPYDQRQDLGKIAEPYNLVNSSIGQGPVLVSPVQVASMINVILSDGFYRQPRLVREIRTNNGRTDRRFDIDQGRKAVSSATAAQIRLLLEYAVDRGTGREASVPVFGSAGKTGSAQVSGEKSGVNAWFAGYAPRENPRYIITVLVEDGKSGGETAAPVFRDIMEKILSM